MIDYGSNANAALASGARGICQLVEMRFVNVPAGTPNYLYVTNAPIDITANDSGGVSRTWLGWGALTSISPLKETMNVSKDTLTLGLALVNSAMLTAAIADAAAYRGKRVVIYDLVFNDSFTVKQDQPTIRWTGFMDKVNINREYKDETLEINGRIEMVCTRAGMSRARKNEGLRLTHAQQQERYPDDLGLEYLQALVEKPAVWLPKELLMV